MKVIFRIYWLVILMMLTSLPGYGQTSTDKDVDWSQARIGSFATSNYQDGGFFSGFMRYRGKVHDCDFFTLSVDTGSAQHDEDLRLYVRQPSGVIIKIFSLPMVDKMYVPKELDGLLNIYLTDGSMKQRDAVVSAKPLMSIDLVQLAEIYKGNLQNITHVSSSPKK